MVVADEDPPRKRSRLSLKSRKGDNTAQTQSEDSEPPPLETTGTVPQGPVLKSEQDVSDCSPPVIDLTESDLPSEGPGAPPVASMENLGNTCFLNSVLEVLRYTPCFLEGLEQLYRHIIYLEKIKSNDVVQASEDVNTEPSMAWDLVKNLFKMYKRMEKREETFSQFANADVTSMAVKPDRVLDVIRQLNPMFEGNMQHDAQEVLRCLLCYLEDSERELHSDYANILALHPALLKTPNTPRPDPQISNPVLEKFLSGSKSKFHGGKNAVSTLNFDHPQSYSTSKDSLDQDDKIVTFKQTDSPTRKPDFLDSITADSKCHESNPTKKRKFYHSKLKKVDENDEVDGLDEKPQSLAGLCPKNVASDDKHSQIPPTSSNQRVRRSARQRFVSRRIKENGLEKDGEKTAQENSVLESDTECDVGLKASAYKVLVNGDDKGPETVDKSQPTILSMFGKKSGPCRRLGMRGRVIQNHPTPLTPSLSPSSPESPDLRRSPRKPNTSRPVAMTASPRTQNGVVTSSASPARPDEFPVHAVSQSQESGFDQSGSELPETDPYRSPLSAQVWDSCESDSPTIVFKDGTVASNTDSQHTENNHNDNHDDVSTDGEPPDLSRLDSDRNSLTKGITTPVKSRLEKMLESKSTRLPSPAKPSTSCVTPSPRAGVEGKRCRGNAGKLMIKLEKCDHLCNSPTISASAALKALKGNSNACRKMMFSEDIEEETNHDADSDEDETSLGTNSSFTSVPLKSVCVKVEKCDMVCSSPNKSVSARFAASHLAKQRTQRFNIMEKLFQGTMMMRTKCLECERCTERKESFQDVSVPLTAEESASSDSESEEEKDSSLLRLMRAFTDVEHLRDDNKYFCDQCFCYVEAERSLHYETLPNILTVHLKRFSATGMFGYLSKINDHVTVPLSLSCLRYKCPKPCFRRDHRYTLYAIITHAGSTISAGHYLSYIKVRPNAVHQEILSSHLSDPLHRIHDNDPLPPSPTPSEKLRESPRRRAARVSYKGDEGMESLDLKESCVNDGSEAESSADQYHWLECDDETIRILSEKEFHGRLVERDGALRGTPYVLFYHRLDTWRPK